MKNSNKSLLNLVSYVALMLIALLLFIRNLLPVIGIVVEGPLIAALSTLQNILMIVVIGVIAYDFAKSSKKWVKVLYWIAVAIFVVGTILVWF